MSLPPSNYFCHNCGRTNPTGNTCPQCQSEFLEEIPHNNQQISSTNDFQNLFNHNFDIQTFTNMLLLMLGSATSSDILQQRHHRRGGRLPRRIKRVTHRYLPFFDFLPNTSLVNMNGLVPQQIFNTQFQSNIPLIQAPLQLLIFDPNQENFNFETLTQLLNDDMNTMSLTRDDINRLPTLTMTSSNLSLNPSCAICLENFDLSSEVKQLPICHHMFHTNCLTEWLLRHGNCPMCRTGIRQNQERSISIYNNQPVPQENPSNLVTSDTRELPRFDSDSSSNTE